MTYAAEMANDYFQRLGHTDPLDAAYQYQMTALRDMVTRLEVILEDEGVPPHTILRVLRAVLYGSPSRADAELRMRETERTIDMLRSRPPMPTKLLGLLPS